MNGTYIRDTWFVPEKELTPCETVYVDGTYEGVGMGIGYGYGGDVPVTVVVEGGKIASVIIGENGETPDLGGVAMDYVAKRIVANNGVEGIDAVGSATISSNAVINAVKEALAQAV